MIDEGQTFLCSTSEDAITTLFDVRPDLNRPEPIININEQAKPPYASHKSSTTIGLSQSAHIFFWFRISQQLVRYFHTSVWKWAQNKKEKGVNFFFNVYIFWIITLFKFKITADPDGISHIHKWVWFWFLFTGLSYWKFRVQKLGIWLLIENSHEVHFPGASSFYEVLQFV